MIEITIVCKYTKMHGHLTDMQKKLLEIAEEIYAKKGNKLSLSEITAAAGVTRPTIYKYLGDKATILARLARNHDGEIEPHDIDERIMRGVQIVVGTLGFKAATIQAISEESGVGQATVYRRFKDKDNLIKSFITRQKTGDPVPNFPSGFSNEFDDQLAFIVDHMLHFMSENRTLVSIIFSSNAADQAYVQTLRDKSNSSFSKILLFFERHQSDGNILVNLTPEDLAINLFGMIYAQAIIMPSGKSIDPDQVAHSICQMFKSIRIG